MSLLRHFLKTLRSEVGSFMRNDIKTGVIFFGIVAAVYTATHLKFNSANFWSDLAALGCQAAIAVFLFAIWVVYRTTKAVWGDPTFSDTDPIAVLANANESQKTSLVFRVQLLAIAIVLISALSIACFSVGAIVYRTGEYPILDPQEQANIGASITVAVRALGSDGYPQMPPVKPDATGFWIGPRGYLISCVNQSSGKVSVLVPLPLSVDHGSVMTGRFMSLPAAIKYRQPSTGLSVLYVESRQLDYVQRSLKLDIARLSDKEVRNGEQIGRSGFSVEHSGPEETTLSYDPGHLIRTDIDGRNGTPFGLYLSIPFRSWDCGAPILNERGMLIGVVEHGDNNSSENQTVAAPSPYVEDLLKTAISESAKQPVSR
jgi:hypothetical protein